MPRIRSWTDEQLILAVAESRSYRMVLIKLNLIPAGGNYEQIKRRITKLTLSTDHFTGIGWNVGLQFRPVPPQPLEKLLVKNGTAQSFLLKKRLFFEGMKTPVCELCGWHKMSEDGRVSVELDHINGDHHDNRLENLRILCPNCHSLQPTHRGRNKRVRLAKISLRAGAGTR
jgi:5-methylcytosine-specific restriction endonuclease McrA